MNPDSIADPRRSPWSSPTADANRDRTTPPTAKKNSEYAYACERMRGGAMSATCVRYGGRKPLAPIERRNVKTIDPTIHGVTAMRTMPAANWMIISPTTIGILFIRSSAWSRRAMREPITRPTAPPAPRSSTIIPRPNGPIP